MKMLLACAIFNEEIQGILHGKHAEKKQSQRKMHLCNYVGLFFVWHIYRYNI